MSSGDRPVSLSGENADRAKEEKQRKRANAVTVDDMQGKEIIILAREEKKVCGYDEEFEL